MSESKKSVPEVEVLEKPKPAIPPELIEELKKPDKKPIDLEEGKDYFEAKGNIIDLKEGVDYTEKKTKK